MEGLVFNIQRYSLQDGPGIRTTVFLKGCPLSCWWCQNPESRSSAPEVVVIEGRCVHCGACRAVCDNAREGGEPPAAACVRCGLCVDACPTGARHLVGLRMTVEDVCDEVAKDRIFFEESGGGVTFSGGEPLLQDEFLITLLDACRARGIHTAVDTCGYGPIETLLRVAERTDLFLYDLKVMDEERHRAFTGVSNRGIMENLETLARVHPAIWIRIPVIPGVNDEASQIEGTARYVASLPGIRRVDLLPYHETGLHKFARLGETYRLGRIDPPSAERMEGIAARFRAHGLDAQSGG